MWFIFFLVVELWHCLPTNFSTRFYTNKKHSTQTKICSNGVVKPFLKISKMVFKKIGPLSKKLWKRTLHDMYGQSSCTQIPESRFLKARMSNIEYNTQKITLIHW